MPTTTQVLHPILRYRDPHAAITWLERTLGFERKAVHEDDQGVVQHAEMSFRGATVMFGAVRDPAEGGPAALAKPPGSTEVYVVIDDPDALHARVVEAGGDVAAPLTDQDYGSRDFSVRDPEGNIWSFGTYDPWGEGA